MCNKDNLQCTRLLTQADVTPAGDQHIRLNFTHFVFAVANLIFIWEGTIFNSCYVLSMETCVFI